MLDLDFIFGNSPWPVEVTTTPNQATLKPQDIDAGLGVILTEPDLQPPDVDGAEWQDIDTPSGWILQRIDAADLEIIDLSAPCPNCGGIVFWWDAAGGVHCEACSPAPGRGQRLRQRAAELRGRYPLTRESDLRPRPLTVPRAWPPVVPDSIMADPILTCSDCGRRAVIGGQPGRPAGLCYSCWARKHRTASAAGWQAIDAGKRCEISTEASAAGQP